MAKNYVVDKKKEAAKKDSFFKRTKKFFKDIKSELKLVSWPDKQQTIKLTGAVLAFVIIIGVIIGGFDYIISSIMKLVL